MVYRYKCITLEAIISWIEVGGLASLTYCMCSEVELCSQRRFTGIMLQMSPCEPNTGVSDGEEGGGGGEMFHSHACVWQNFIPMKITRSC